MTVSGTKYQLQIPADNYAILEDLTQIRISWGKRTLRETSINALLAEAELDSQWKTAQYWPTKLITNWASHQTSVLLMSFREQYTKTMTLLQITQNQNPIKYIKHRKQAYFFTLNLNQNLEHNKTQIQYLYGAEA